MSVPLPQSVSIAQRPKACLDSLTGSCSLLNGDNRQKVAHQFSRFRLWTQNIGVFCGPTSSLDHRLRAAPRMSLAVLDIIEVIQIQADKIMQLQKYHVAEQQASVAVQGDRQTEGYPSSDLPESRQALSERAPSSAVEDTISRMEADIDWLYNLSLIIRRAGHKDPFSRAANFPIRDRDDNGEEKDITEASYDSFRTELSMNYAKAGQNILDRLVATVGLRRRYLLYCQSHKRKLAYDLDNATSSSSPEQKTALTVAPSVTQPTEHEEQSDNPVRPAESASTSGASPFMPELNSAVQITSAPLLNDQEKEHECPFCCLFLPRDTFTTREDWRRHVEKDLRPYVCVHEECSLSHPIFESFEEWLQHMCKPHKTQWICTRHSAEEGSSLEQQTGIFDSQEALKNHLETDHGEIYTQHQVSVLSQRSQTISPILTRCPFCNEYTLAITRQTKEEVATDPFLYRHVANHLVEIALMSLPDYGGVKEFEETNNSDEGLSSVHGNPDSDSGNEARSSTQDRDHSMSHQSPASNKTDFKTDFAERHPSLLPRVQNSPERLHTRLVKGGCVRKVEPRYIDRERLKALLDRLFGPQTYSAEMKNGKWIITTPVALTSVGTPFTKHCF